VEGLRFEQGENRVQVPVLLPGKNSWSVTTSVTTASAEDEDEKLLIDLRCTWRTRKPFSFRLSIPRTEQVREAEQQGALELTRRDLERVRAAGIRAEVVFPDSVFRKEAALSEVQSPKVGKLNRMK
jgi:hypothetical protein